MKNNNRKTAILVFLYKHSQNTPPRLLIKIYRILYFCYTRFVLGFELPYQTKIGEGFTIYHSAHGSVVNPQTKIGRNVSLRQNTTIGAKGFNNDDKAPIIEDGVTIGPNVCIIGDITIGEGAIIGAGAVVVKDVPPHAVVAGNPAKILKFT